MSDYMDHWADNDPEPTEVKDFRVGLRIPGGSGVIYVHVDATCWQQAHTKALDKARDVRIESCLSKGNY